MQPPRSTLRPHPEGGWLLTLPDGGTATGFAAELLEMAEAMGHPVAKELPDA